MHVPPLHRPLLMVASLLVSGTTVAATITVNSESYGSLASFCTLQDAIEAANTDTARGGCSAGNGDDVIELGTSEYIAQSADFYLGNEPLALPAIRSVIRFNTSGAILRAAADTAGFSLLGVGANGELSGANLMITDAPRHGLILDKGTATLQQSTIKDNGASGIVLDNQAKLELNYSTVSNNRGADATLPAGISLHGGSHAYISHSDVSQNQGGGLGCIDCDDTANNVLTISDSLVAANRGGKIGGIGASNTLLIVTRTSIENNQSDASAGGIETALSALNTVNQSSIRNNSSKNGPGGIRANSNTRIVSSTISGNRVTQYGTGGVSLANGAWLYNSTVSSNLGIGNSGGIKTDSGAMIQSSTIAYNQLQVESNWTSGSELVAAGLTGQAFLANTVISHNVGGADCSSYLEIGQLRNFIGDGSCGAELYGDAGLLGLADNGGYTDTHAITGSSPLIDQGSAVFCSPPQVLLDDAPGNFDQRGELRSADGDLDGEPVCDIGAYERGLTTRSALQTTEVVAGDSGARSSTTNDTEFSPVTELDSNTPASVNGSGGGSLHPVWLLGMLTGYGFRKIAIKQTLKN